MVLANPSFYFGMDVQSSPTRERPSFDPKSPTQPLFTHLISPFIPFSPHLPAQNPNSLPLSHLSTFSFGSSYSPSPGLEGLGRTKHKQKSDMPQNKRRPQNEAANEEKNAGFHEQRRRNLSERLDGEERTLLRLVDNKEKQRSNRYQRLLKRCAASAADGINTQSVPVHGDLDEERRTPSPKALLSGPGSQDRAREIVWFSGPTRDDVGKSAERYCNSAKLFMLGKGSGQILPREFCRGKKENQRAQKEVVTSWSASDSRLCWAENGRWGEE
ncbi:hypothetical protein ACRALDRAFT_208861 [Sodiomyces alcalophilus JCM 7366]|uniref:uncharacterized protein n=1 Tax=Sodiomyces alcalophilus JCM 7366 TaxID=591952 RepID=UPI0039B559BD